MRVIWELFSGFEDWLMQMLSAQRVRDLWGRLRWRRARQMKGAMGIVKILMPAGVETEMWRGREEVVSPHVYDNPS
jgi:hypothetical protein